MSCASCQSLVRIVPESVARIDLDRTAQEAPAPVALAVALKYAGDCVRVCTDDAEAFCGRV